MSMSMRMRMRIMTTTIRGGHPRRRRSRSRSRSRSSCCTTYYECVASRRGGVWGGEEWVRGQRPLEGDYRPGDHTQWHLRGAWSMANVISTSTSTSTSTTTTGGRRPGVGRICGGDAAACVRWVVTTGGHVVMMMVMVG